MSRKQQHVVVALVLIYGVWLLWRVAVIAQQTVRSAPLAHPEPPELRFYLDPLIDVNTANHAELQLLPHIGPVIAERMIAYRRQYGAFTSLATLERIHRIGPKTLRAIRPYLKPLEPQARRPQE